MSYTYTTEAEIMRVLSREGWLSQADDDRDGIVDPALLQEVVGEATEEINLYLAQRYRPEDLANHTLVRRWATYFACYLVSLRRGNPAHFTGIVERITGWLERIFANRMNLPGLPVRKEMGPAMSNLEINDLYRRRKIRVDPVTSVRGQNPDQDVAWDWTWE
ncbi:MAG: DUF1320 family protein [Deltaproteobacteria bacterium]|nr:DUF1320 family protein [Deltaproteobacteria bacterium]